MQADSKQDNSITKGQRTVMQADSKQDNSITKGQRTVMQADSKQDNSITKRTTDSHAGRQSNKITA